MAKSKTKSGVKRVGVEDGKIKYAVRLLARDPVTKRVIVDTWRNVLVDDVAEAQSERKRLTEEARQMKLGKTMGGGPLRFSEAAVERWPKTITRYATKMVWSSYMRRAAKDFGQRWLHKITEDDWQRWLNRQVGARTTVMGIRMALINMYEWAIDNGHAPSPNPVEDTKVKRKRHTSDVAAKLAELETPKKKGLTVEELRRYGEAHRELFPHTYPLVLAMLMLGSRYSEASALKRTDLDWQTGDIVIRRAQVDGRIGPPKADKARANAIVDEALAVLRGHVAASPESAWLFEVPAVWHGRRRRNVGPRKEDERAPVWSYDTIRRHIKVAMAAAGVRTDNASHFARHTMIGLTKNRMPDDALRAFVGHASEKVHEKYGEKPITQIAKTMNLAMFRKQPAPQKKRRG